MSETSGFGGDSEQEIQKEPFATGTSFGFEDGTATGRDEGQPISRGRRIKRGRLAVLLVATVFVASVS